MRFQPVKCNIINANYTEKKINASYSLDGTVLENVDKIRYLSAYMFFFHEIMEYAQKNV